MCTDFPAAFNLRLTQLFLILIGLFLKLCSCNEAVKEAADTATVNPSKARDIFTLK